jgi:hypothetical protein
MLFQQRSLGALEFFAIPGGEDEADTTPGEAGGDGQPEAARASGDKDDCVLGNGAAAQDLDGERSGGYSGGAANNGGSYDGSANEGCSFEVWSAGSHRKVGCGL